VVIRCRGAAGQQQLGQRHLARQLQRLRREPRPDRVEGQQPVEQRLVDHRPPGAGEGLVEVVVGVDQPRQYHVLTSVEGLIHRQRGRGAGGKQFGNDTVFDHQSAWGFLVVGSEEGEGILDPDSMSSHGRLSPEWLSSE